MGSLKIPIYWGVHEKTIYREELPKRMRGETVCSFKGGLVKNRGDIFEGRG